MGKQKNNSSFILNLPLKTEKFQDDILNKRMEIGRHLYNSAANLADKRYREMIKTKVYRQARAEIADILEKIKNCSKDHKKRLKTLEAKKEEAYLPINELRKKYRISEYDFHADITPMRYPFKKHIDANTAQKIGTHLWKAYEKLIYGDGKAVHFKRYGDFNSLEGKTIKTGIRFKEGYILWNQLKIKVTIDPKNPYEVMAFGNQMKYCRIVRKFIRGNYKFYVQLVFEGFPTAKVKPGTGEIKHKLGTGPVGLDIGTQTLAVSSITSVQILELADKVQTIEKEKRRIQRKMDRSRRASNPENFNENGTLKKKGSKKLVWIRSNRYLRQQNQLKELQRKQAAIRKYQHECLTNEIIGLGGKFYVETMNYKGLQKRAKKTEKNPQGNYKRKKRFGKSLANKAPAMFLDILKRKLKYRNCDLHKINTQTAKASQYNHKNDDYTKKTLSKRWTDVGEYRIQRDMYSAFLIMNIKEDLKTIDKEKCDQSFDNFRRLHDKEVLRLTGQRNLRSISI